VAEDAERFGWKFFRMAPNERTEPEIIAEIIAKVWSGEPLALVEDGTVYGRELVESVRLALEMRGIKPVYVDNYRPSLDKQFSLVRRIQKSGATHVFIGGDRLDAAIIARDAAEAELDLVFMGGDALNAPDDDVPLRNGVLAVIVPDPERLASAQDLARVFQRADMTPNGYRIPAYAAGQVVQAANAVSQSGNQSLADAIASKTFETALGRISFNADGDMQPSPLQLMVWRDVEFVPVDETEGTRD
jgi:branched-chain amino acid transport system substrate-binding protein